RSAGHRHGGADREPAEVGEQLDAGAGASPGGRSREDRRRRLGGGGGGARHDQEKHERRSNSGGGGLQTCHLGRSSHVRRQAVDASLYAGCTGSPSETRTLKGTTAGRRTNGAR